MKHTAEPRFALLPQSGRYALVQFWAAYDAASRAQNIVWSRYFARTVSDKIAYRAISLDPSDAVYQQTIALDKLDALNQYRNSSDARRMTTQYGLEHNMHAYLIDDEGIVLRVDPTIEELEQFYLL